MTNEELRAAIYDAGQEEADLLDDIQRAEEQGDLPGDLARLEREQEAAAGRYISLQAEARRRGLVII